MSTFDGDSELRVVVQMSLSEADARALLSVIDGGVEGAVDHILSRPGTRRPDRRQLKSFLDDVDSRLRPILDRADDARAVAAGTKIAREIW